MNRPLTVLVADWPVQLIGKASNGIVDIVVFPKCSRIFIELSDFSKFRESDKSLKHELSSI